MLSLNRWIAASLVALSFSTAVPPVFAQETPAQEETAETEEDTLEEEPEQTEDDPPLPDSMLILPEEDPEFVPDPNQIPLEDDFLFMPQARSPIFWRLELREQLGGTSNVDQLLGAPGSLTNRTSINGIFRYTLPSETQILARSQAFLFNFFNVPERDQFLAIPLSVTVSQWLDRWNLYGGYVPIVSSSLNRTDGNVQRFDQDFLLGATYYLPLEQNYFFAGYQLDYLLAQSTTAQFVGNQILAGYRHTLMKDLYGFIDARVQPRTYTATPDILDEVRLGAGAAIQWHVLRPWLILEARGDYNQNIHLSSAERNASIFSIGLNIIGAIQSKQ